MGLSVDCSCRKLIGQDGVHAMGQGKLRERSGPGRVHKTRLHIDFLEFGL